MDLKLHETIISLESFDEFSVIISGGGEMMFESSTQSENLFTGK